ncbi:hypothetical protein N7466_011627 [Penicillium verhagenii]|uniref:uncharacterized protein n=1 Tax=Penicillium verhagenii TaxID=1562060 RepID=UPI002545B574|nr:uncharacterized protein N7466_011627 [Penicillium verhagenii]KAJ5915694.1 hypothetical protein N7466_011627 [Penicillium verhagenii]
MPHDEEGGKWACESCVRGHRSTKCEHWDRIMVKIHKAGRPLTKCPHDETVCDGNCTKTTRAFVVKIMKGSDCLCRPVRSAPETGTPTPAPSDQMAFPASGNMPKPDRRKSVTQKMSENHTEAVRSTPEHFKVENGTSNNLNGVAQYDQPQDRYSQYRNHPFSTNPSLAGTPSSGSSQPTIDSQPGRSCCSSRPSHQPAASNDAHARQSHTATWNDSGMHDMQYMLPTRAEADWYPQDAAPPRPFYGRYLSSPPQPQQLSAILHAPHFHIQNMHMPQYFSGYVSMGPPASYPSQPTLASTPDEGMRLDCNCGPGCQCVGCSSHPFNSSTRQVVQEMGILLARDGVGQSPVPHVAPPQHHAFQSTDTPSPMGAMQGNQNLFDLPSPPSMQAAGQRGSQRRINEGGLIQPDYATLEYAVNVPACSNTTGICRCGDGCECFGCLTHGGHNGIDPSMPDPQLQDAQAQELFNELSISTIGSSQPWNFEIDFQSNFEMGEPGSQVPTDM